MDKSQMIDAMNEVTRYGNTPIARINNKATFEYIFWKCVFGNRASARYAADIYRDGEMMKLLAPSFAPAKAPPKAANP